jgi:hypothetical protein
MNFIKKYWFLVLPLPLIVAYVYRAKIWSTLERIGIVKTVSTTYTKIDGKSA